MGSLKQPKLKFQTVWAPVLNKHFFKLQTQVAPEDP